MKHSDSVSPQRLAPRSWACGCHHGSLSTPVRRGHSYVRGCPAECRLRPLTQKTEEKERKEPFTSAIWGTALQGPKPSGQPSWPSVPHRLWAERGSERACVPQTHTAPSGPCCSLDTEDIHLPCRELAGPSSQKVKQEGERVVVLTCCLSKS